jgi:hypothetical protein
MHPLHCYHQKCEKCRFDAEIPLDKQNQPPYTRRLKKEVIVNLVQSNQCYGTSPSRQNSGRSRRSCNENIFEGTTLAGSGVCIVVHDLHRNGRRRRGRLQPGRHPAETFRDSDPLVRMHFTQMIDQVPSYYRQKPNINLTSVDQMLCLMNRAMDRAPSYDETDLVGFPINALLNWTMGVPAGFHVYRNDKVKKGEELGYFQYGGSTYVLVFRPGVIKKFLVKKDTELKMGQAIAIAN